jgi:predicted ribonuclease YlaK
MTSTPRPKRAKKSAFKEIESAMKENFAPFDFKFRKRDYKFTDKQKRLIDQILDPEIKIVFIDGVAGTSKSLVSVYCGLTMLKEKKTNKMLYMRSVVESAQKGLGFLKGSLEEKMEVWRHVLDSKCEELIEPTDMHKVMNSGKLEALPINYIRGASWKNMFVILDECQNLDYDAFKLVLSRIGEDTKLIICGDSDQSDIRDSGFSKIYQMFDNDAAKNMGIISFSFEESDIVRSELCKFIVQTFREEKERGH